MGRTSKQEQLALILARKLLEELADPQKFPGLPAKLRERAADVVRHFPGVTKIDLLYQSLRKEN